MAVVCHLRDLCISAQKSESSTGFHPQILMKSLDFKEQALALLPPQHRLSFEQSYYYRRIRRRIWMLNLSAEKEKQIQSLVDAIAPDLAKLKLSAFDQRMELELKVMQRAHDAVLSDHDRYILKVNKIDYLEKRKGTGRVSEDF